MGLRLITAATAEPISVGELKLQCRIDGSDEDALLPVLIAAARAKAENYTGAALMPQVWEQTLDTFPEAEIEILKPPASGIESVRYIDAAGAEQTLSPAAYVLDRAAFPGWLLPVSGAQWPATLDAANAVAVRYQCGYADAASVPADIRAWLLMTAAFLYAQREALSMDGKASEIPGRFCDALLDPYRVWKV